MTWIQRHRVRHYFTNSVWILPSLGMVTALIAVRLTHWLDATMDFKARFNPEGVRPVLGIVGASIFTFVVFVCSALLIAVQLASQLTPRIIAFVFRDPITKWSLTLFVFVFTYSVAVLVRIETTVPQLSTQAATYGFMISPVAFLYLIDHVGKALRPSGSLRAVARLGRSVIEDVYRRRLVESRERLSAPPEHRDQHALPDHCERREWVASTVMRNHGLWNEAIHRRPPLHCLPSSDTKAAMNRRTPKK